MTLHHVLGPAGANTTLAHGVLSLEDQQAAELLALDYLEKRLPPGCTQVALRLEVDLFLETPVLNGEWKAQVPVVVAREPTSRNPPGTYRVVDTLGGWELHNFVCPHCAKMYRTRREITSGACLEEYWKLYRDIAKGRDKTAALAAAQLPPREVRKDG